jgi:lipopolysaccharide export system protein LptA
MTTAHSLFSRFFVKKLVEPRRSHFLLLSGLCAISMLCAQEQIRLIHADSLEAVPQMNARRLAGNVQFEHQGHFLKCQQAYQFPEANRVKLFHQVYIQTTDQVEAWGDSLIYDGNSKFLNFSGNVHLQHKAIHLFAPALTYSRVTGVASYMHNGKLLHKTMQLKSEQGFYYQYQDSSYFQNNVILQDTHYTLTTSCLGYHIPSDRLYFLAPTAIRFKQGQLLRFQRGTYVPSSHHLHAYQQVWFQDSSFLFHVDTLYFNDSTGEGKAYCSGSLWNRDSTLYLSGEWWQFHHFGDTIVTTDHAYLIYVSQKDTMVIYADTFLAIQSDTSQFLIAYGSVRVIHSQFQSRTDSLVYNGRDSTIHLLQRRFVSSGIPLIWAGSYQISAKQVFLYLKNGSLDSMAAHSEVFALQWDSLSHYHQVKSDFAFAKFRQNELTQIHFSPRVNALYFLQENRKYQGANLISSATMDLFFEGGRVTKILFSQSPEGTLIPYSQLKTFELAGFRNFHQERPLSYLLPLDKHILYHHQKRE